MNNYRKTSYLILSLLIVESLLYVNDSSSNQMDNSPFDRRVDFTRVLERPDLNTEVARTARRPRRSSDESGSSKKRRRRRRRTDGSGGGSSKDASVAVNARVGYSIYSNVAMPGLSGGLGFGMDARFWLSDLFGLGGSIYRTSSSVSTADAAADASTTSGTAGSTTASSVASSSLETELSLGFWQFGLVPFIGSKEGSFRPYGGGFIGLVSTKVDLESTSSNAVLASAGSATSASETSLAFGGLAGADISLSEKMFFGVKAEYIIVNGEALSTSLINLNATIGVLF